MRVNPSIARHQRCVVCARPAIRFSDAMFPVCEHHPDATDRLFDWTSSGFIDGGPFSMYPLGVQ